MKKMNKKGFTLIELLAVIVVLAIVMVIATQKITDVVNSSRSNAFILSYKSVVKQVKDSYTMGNVETCTGSECSKKYDVTDNDYKLTVKENDDKTKYVIILEPASDGKFKQLDLTKYGDAAEDNQCKPEKIDNTAGKCGTFKIGEVSYKGIMGFVAK